MALEMTDDRKAFVKNCDYIVIFLSDIPSSRLCYCILGFQKEKEAEGIEDLRRQVEVRSRDTEVMVVDCSGTEAKPVGLFKFFAQPPAKKII